MDRRRFIAVAGLVALGPTPVLRAQQAAGIRRIAFLEAGSARANQPFLDAFEAGLRDFGYVPGRNVTIDARWADGRAERFPALLAELLARRPEVVVVASHAGALAARVATQTIPIVFVGASDPVGQGLVATLARPGGNITGLSRAVEDGTLGKAVQILMDFVPAATRIGLLWNPAAHVEARVREVDSAVRALGATPLPFEVAARDGFAEAFGQMRSRHVDALVVIGDPLTLSNRATIVRLAAASRVPAVYEFAEFARDGGLVAYAPSVVVMFRRAGTYVDRILRGAPASELPVEQPTVFELVINAKAANALGLRVPTALLLRADQVIR
jgi:putative ABC transport system substrate-binding protein